ncbi:PPC domain-containing DNA-binding protein [Geoalkalibacter halelectricus]|uniref:DNA-binding protein n=1 Tax=Geoalkalibacter halelectricus TaxID=2847045 RepID=A0ABY5ZG41_9BACT|nr:PPC domain-containing DNA-binding protein [Geoalkalibacter halelectricus]MDO3379545.1 DNA-binding protein [Geoalkalibacter halelectricus]UWZ78133.1 DNA-binding protein [Geoalkalibacter halelectricus]
MKDYWHKEWEQGRRFILKIKPGRRLKESLSQFVAERGIKYAVIASAVGSVSQVHLRGIKAGARLPITEARMNQHRIEGPLELVGLEGNLVPDESGQIDCHLHILVAKSSGEVLGGHLFDAEVFASCEIILSEALVAGIERHPSKSGGVPTIFIQEGEDRP